MFMKREKSPLKSRMAKALQIPSDVAFQECFMNLQENQKILLQNFYHILEYTSQEILIQTTHHKIRIQGNTLEIDYFTKDEIQISGNIQMICYEK